MNVDAVYSALIDCGRFFFGGWVVMLLLASVIVFRRDMS
jgi:hypothetical protein